MAYSVDGKGFYGEFGGAYIPEILHKCVHDLQDAYLPIIESDGFKQEFRSLLRDYVGAAFAAVFRPKDEREIRLPPVSEA